MIITINHKKILTALKSVERVVSRNISLPSLNSILLKTENGKLKLSATNLELGINYWIGAKIDQEGEVLVPAKIFSDFLSNANDEKITIKVVKNIISINSEKYKTQILGMETKDFPIIPKIKKDLQFKISSQGLKEALLNVLDSAAISETRPELSGVCVNVGVNKIDFAATDSFRLSEKVMEIKDGINKSFILPRNTVIEVSRLINDYEGELSIAISENQVLIYGEDFEIISRLIDGHYPEYKKVIPDKFISLARVNKNDFEKNIRMASIFSSTISDIKLIANNNILEIKAKNTDKGEIVTNIACEVKNEPFEVAVNYNYLLDGLKVLPTENIIIEFTGDGSPLVLKGENKKDQVYVIMPLRS
ncbi:MAG: DNA polymerase III subunit beta [Patescibacteria group bacterium]